VTKGKRGERENAGGPHIQGRGRPGIRPSRRHREEKRTFSSISLGGEGKRTGAIGPTWPIKKEGYLKGAHIIEKKEIDIMSRLEKKGPSCYSYIPKREGADSSVGKKGRGGEVR